MSLQVETSTPAAVPAKQTVAHPLAPLSGEEISAASQIIRGLWPDNTVLQFKVVTLEEPPKAQVLPYLEAEHAGSSLPSIERKVFVNYYLKNTVSKQCRGGKRQTNKNNRISSTKR